MTLNQLSILKTMKYCSIIFLVVLSLYACGDEHGYASIVQRELDSGVRNDSLFLGIHFGMTANDFYEHCWNLNRKGLIREGAMNTTVYYEVDELPHRGAMDFYPVFKDGKIQAMTGFTHYIGWAPWNKHLWAEALIEDTKNLFESWYGKGFFEVKSPGQGKAYVKIDGNRQILLFYERDERVEFLISDLSLDKDLIKIESL